MEQFNEEQIKKEKEILKKKELRISIDPGFDGMKIIINMRMYHMPFVIEDISQAEEKNIFRMATQGKDYITCNYEGKTYLVGEYVKRSILELDHLKDSESKASMERFYTLERFKTKDFRVGLNAGIGYALLNYQEDTKEFENAFFVKDLSKWTIYVGAALPHQCMDRLWEEGVQDALVGTHKFTLETGKKGITEFDFNIDKANAYYQSQTFCALYSVIADDNGEPVSGDINKDLPAIVIDAGYKTLGRFKLARDGRIDNGDSDQTFAMYNINLKIANDLRELNPEITPYYIESAYYAGEYEKYFDVNGEVKKVNLKELREKEIEASCKNLKKYMLDKFQKMVDVNLFVIAGGTGSLYFPYIEKWAEDRINLVDKIKLADDGFYNQKCEPVYAVAVGMYKNLSLILSMKQA